MVAVDLRATVPKTTTVARRSTATFRAYLRNRDEAVSSTYNSATIFIFPFLSTVIFTGSETLSEPIIIVTCCSPR